MLRAPLQDGASPLHEKSSQIGVPTFAGTGQFMLTPGGVFSGTTPSQAANSRPLWKASDANRRDDCGRRHSEIAELNSARFYTRRARPVATLKVVRTWADR